MELLKNRAKWLVAETAAGVVVERRLAAVSG